MKMPPSTDKLNFDTFIKIWVPIIGGVISIILGSVFWIQRAGDDKYYSKISGDNLADQIQETKTDIEVIRNQNNDIILSLGRIEGRLDQESADADKSSHPH